MNDMFEAFKKAGADKKYTIKEPAATEKERPSYRRGRPFPDKPRDTGRKGVSAHAGGAATAPYNFVSLAGSVLPSPLDQGRDWQAMDEKERREAFKQYILSEGKNSGYIELSLEALTPLFIGSGGESREAFFSPAGRPLIPGSTLRGLVRSLFAIVTAGAMRRDENFADRHLYFRCLMAAGLGKDANKDLHQYYRRRMMTPRKGAKGDTCLVKNAKPGFLYQLNTDNAYYIAPCHMESILATKYGHIPKESRVDWDEKGKGAFILTGYNKNKQYVRYLSEPDWDNALPVDDTIVEEYRADRNRRGVDLLQRPAAKLGGDAGGFAYCKDIKFIVPCFYITEDGKVSAFGHGRSFRIPYKKSVGDRVPAAMQSDCVDFSDAVFGRKEWWAGRVSFEDAELTREAGSYDEETAKPLLQPNPTSFQLYLTQGNALAHWDSEADVSIRGYKMYWHKALKDCRWQDKDADPKSKVSKMIAPLKEGSMFTSRIHFRELSDVELGALLKIFRLGGEKDIAYKIGRGKSLGLGSVRIDMSLHLDDAGWYTSFSGGWDAPQQCDAEPFIRTFDDYVQAHLSRADKAGYDRSMEELALLLDWKNTAQPRWSEKTKMMSDDTGKTVDARFVQRCVLPGPEQVVESKK